MFLFPMPMRWSTVFPEVNFGRMAGDLKTFISARVRSARKAAGLTQEELASRIGVTPETISNIERARQVPSVETLCAMAETMALAPTELLPEKSGGAAKSAQRMGLEDRMRSIVSGLSDSDLGLAVDQVELLARRRP